MADLEALAASLAETAANLGAHIERRAREIAQPRVEQQRAESARIVAEQRAEMESMRERKDDLIAELRRQLDAAVKSRDREFDELNARHEREEDRRRAAQRFRIGPDGGLEAAE